MRFLHLADLHLGRCVLEAPMLEDQRYILDELVRLAIDRRADAVVIAGDVYDRSIPPAEAVELLDRFLNGLSDAGIAVLLVAGNHDSPERLDFGRRLFESRRVYIAGRYTGAVPRVTLTDEAGPVDFYLLPFVKPAVVNARLGRETAATDEAVAAALEGLSAEPGRRSVLVAHQFVCAGGISPETCGSETVSVGGSDQVDVSRFDRFDYVALGHLHRAQRMGRDTVRYAGSPLKYSLSEARHVKSAPLVTLAPDRAVEVELCPLTPLHDLRCLRGSLEELLAAGRAEPDSAEDYIHAVLTDADALDPAERLRAVYPRLLHVELAPREGGAPEDASIADPLAHKSEEDLFEEFYRTVHGESLSEPQRTVLREAIEAARKALE